MLPQLERGWLARGEHVVITSPCSAPPGISCLTCTPNSFFRARPPPWVEPVYPFALLLTDSSFREPLDDGDDPHCIPQHVSQEFLTLYRLTHAHIWRVFVPPNATYRMPASRQSPHEAIQGRTGQNLSTLPWLGNPTPSRRHCQHWPQHCRLAQSSHEMDPRRAAGY